MSDPSVVNVVYVVAPAVPCIRFVRFNRREDLMYWREHKRTRRPASRRVPPEDWWATYWRQQAANVKVQRRLRADPR